MKAILKNEDDILALCPTDTIAKATTKGTNTTIHTIETLKNYEESKY